MKPLFDASQMPCASRDTPTSNRSYASKTPVTLRAQGYTTLSQLTLTLETGPPTHEETHPSLGHQRRPSLELPCSRRVPTCRRRTEVFPSESTLRTQEYSQADRANRPHYPCSLHAQRFISPMNDTPGSRPGRSVMCCRQHATLTTNQISNNCPQPRPSDRHGWRRHQTQSRLRRRSGHNHPSWLPLPHV